MGRMRGRGASQQKSVLGHAESSHHQGARRVVRGVEGGRRGHGGGVQRRNVRGGSHESNSATMASNPEVRNSASPSIRCRCPRPARRPARRPAAAPSEPGAAKGGDGRLPRRCSPSPGAPRPPPRHALRARARARQQQQEQPAPPPPLLPPPGPSRTPSTVEPEAPLPPPHSFTDSETANPLPEPSG